MRQIMLLMLWVPALVCSELRNPFIPLATTCSSGVPDEWRFMGVVRQGAMLQGIIRTGRGQWLRVIEGDELGDSWRVGPVSEHQMIVRRVAACSAQEHILLPSGRNET